MFSADLRVDALALPEEKRTRHYARHYARSAKNIYAGTANDSGSKAGSRLLGVYGQKAERRLLCLLAGRAECGLAGSEKPGGCRQIAGANVELCERLSPTYGSACMLSKTLARRARRGIILRLFLKLGAVAAALSLPLVWALFPQTEVVHQVSGGIAQASDAARRLMGRDGGKTEARPATDLDRLRGVAGFAASEIRCLALAVYYEAGREPREAQIGVAQVALSRAAAAKAPKLLCKIVYNGVGTPGACLFDTTCNNVGVTPRQDTALADAVAVAIEVVSGKASAPALAKATHFHETKKPPPWARGLFTLATIGKLRFVTTDQPESAADPTTLH